MAKNKKPLARHTRVHSSIKDPVKPRWMRITKTVMMILMGVVLLISIIGMIIRYYHHISNS